MAGKMLLEGVVLYAGDVERTAAFYREVLGLPMIHKEDHVTHFDAGTVRLAVHRREEGEGAPPGDGFVVFAVEDLDATCAELRRRGAEVQGPKRRPYGRVAYLEDPDGHRIALWHLPLSGPRQARTEDPAVERFERVARSLAD